ncbi:hypothetical protein DEU56DRAFT_9150 [Suillus clintonianus]|uniref:uncharacterized protein n=1 Tax=Suillus clintonianus TaxID=1904413 RepID=UPI001B88144A|nr:uncharacterized protein DEU56DRAFT_9150 [Suillus clintonianus]KAG2157216.1 hypothetical protein DEU56DRAFT_9150 [Suillus clintonianus]
MITASPKICPSGSYEPTTADILIVKQYFKLFSIPLPDELVDDIIDAACYWAHSSITVDRSAVVHAGDMMYMRTLPLAVYNTEGDFLLEERGLLEEGFVLGGLPPTELKWVPPTLAKPFRKIEFQLWSHDQGWVGVQGSLPGTYNGSYSWFDVDVERLDPTSCFTESIRWPSSLLFTAVDAPNLPDDITFTRKDVKCPFLPSPSTLQKNIVAERQTSHHTITWTDLDNVEEGSSDAIAAENRGQGWKSYDGSFVRDLQVGDCITLWMRARFPGWMNNAVKAKITVFWAV